MVFATRSPVCFGGANVAATMSFVQSVAARPMFAKAHSGLATSNRTVSHICMGRSKVMQAEVRHSCLLD